MRRWLALCFGMLLADASIALAGSSDGELARVLQQRFQPSRIEVRDRGRAGAVTRTGQVVALSVHAVPARPFQTRNGRHVLEFARVAVERDGAVQQESAPLTLRRGTKLVVLDVAVTDEEVRMLMHTAEPVTGIPGTPPTYGCVEFIFSLGGPPAEDTERVVHRIERWLEWTPGERVCAPGVDLLCLEP